MWTMWMLCGCEVDKMWMCGGQNVDDVVVLWICGGQNGDDVDVRWTKCG